MDATSSTVTPFTTPGSHTKASEGRLACAATDRADAGADPRRGPGDPAAAADRVGAEAGAAAGGPSSHRLRDRLAPGPRRRRRRRLLRPSRRRRPRRPRRDRRWPERQLRRGARGAGDGRGDPLRGRPAGRPLPRSERRRALRPRPFGDGRSAREHRRGGDDRPLSRRRPECLRPRAAHRGRRDHGLPREARPRRDRHRRDQRRRVLPRAVRARPDPSGRGRLDRARGLPAPRRRGPVRSPPRWLLDGHRHPRSLPAGELGHPRGAGRHRDGPPRRRRRDAGHRPRRRPRGRERDRPCADRGRRHRGGGCERRPPGRHRPVLLDRRGRRYLWLGAALGMHRRRGSPPGPGDRLGRGRDRPGRGPRAGLRDRRGREGRAAQAHRADQIGRSRREVSR